MRIPKPERRAPQRFDGRAAVAQLKPALSAEVDLTIFRFHGRAAVAQLKQDVPDALDCGIQRFHGRAAVAQLKRAL